MNKTKIEWTDYSWNPITGCLHNCWYCYAKKLFTRFHRSFEPTFYPERLSEPSKLNNKKPVKIFCCSVADLFADWTKLKWRKQVLEAIECYGKSNQSLIFQLLTKNPENLQNFAYPDNVWVGVTINLKSELNKIEQLRFNTNSHIKFVSFEPLLEDVGDLNLEGVDWIIVGKLTGSKKIKLQNSWVMNILKQARDCKVPIFIKDNVKWDKKIQEFPNVKNLPS